MEFHSYDLDPSIYDEMFLPDGAPGGIAASSSMP